MPLRRSARHESPPVERDNLFQRIADWVSTAMGRPANILFWAVLVLAWTFVFAFGGPHLASGSWLPGWFASQGYNFPLNLVTTVAELFIGFLVAAATNRAERALMVIIDGIHATVSHVSEVVDRVSTVEDNLSAAVTADTVLTGQVHELIKQNNDLTGQVHAMATQQGTLLEQHGQLLTQVHTLMTQVASSPAPASEPAPAPTAEPETVRAQNSADEVRTAAARSKRGNGAGKAGSK